MRKSAADVDVINAANSQASKTSSSSKNEFLSEDNEAMQRKNSNFQTDITDLQFIL